MLFQISSLVGRTVGAEVFSINQALFETNSLARLQVQAYLLQNAIFLQDGISQMTHIIGGICGTVLGFGMYHGKKR